MHPLQTFSTSEAPPGLLAGASCVCEGDDAALAAVERLARAIGMKPLRIAPEMKALYHAAAVLACNCFVTLMDGALEAASEAGLSREDAWAAFRPLVESAGRNVGRLGTAEALTGPIARGDAATVKRHLEALAAGPEHLLAMYKTMGRYTVWLAARRGSVSAGRARELWDILSADKRPNGPAPKPEPDDPGGEDCGPVENGSP